MDELCQPIKSLGWLGETWGFWIQTGAFVLSALAGVAVIYYNGKQGRLRATIDLIIHQKSDTQLLACIEQVYKLSLNKVQFSKYANDHDSEEFRCILKVLNNHEFIALGIRQGTFDEEIYKKMQYSNVMKVWASSAGIISEIRNTQNIQTLFQEFEWLAQRWRNSPLKKTT